MASARPAPTQATATRSSRVYGAPSAAPSTRTATSTACHREIGTTNALVDGTATYQTSLPSSYSFVPTDGLAPTEPHLASAAGRLVQASAACRQLGARDRRIRAYPARPPREFHFQPPSPVRGALSVSVPARGVTRTSWSLVVAATVVQALVATPPGRRVARGRHGVLASHSRWRARAVAYGRDTLGSVSPDAAVGCGTAAPPVAPNAPWSAGEPEPSGALQRDPVVTLGGHRSEPLSSTPVASRDPAATNSVEAPPPPAVRKWSWRDLMRHTFVVALGNRRVLTDERG
jgi:hypothetical protein